MVQIRVSRQIDAPIDVVFTAVTDIANLPQTSQAIVHTEFLTEQTSGVGTKFRETRRIGKQEMDTDLEITEFAENDHARMVSDSHGTIWDTLFTVRPADDRADATHLELIMDCRAHKLLPRIMNPLLRGMFAKGVEQHADHVKAYCEHAAAR